MADASSDFQRQITCARAEIKNLRQQILGLKHEHLKEINSLKRMITEAATGQILTPSQPTPDPQPRSSNSDNMVMYRPIGHIETPFSNKRAVPRQPSVSDCRGAVVLDTAVYNNPEHACDGLQEFSHMWILFHMHETEANSVPAKVSPPRLRGERRGVFATRSPHRPCPIGLSLVKIVAIEGNRILFSGVDMVNGTPVLDVKPYIPQYDYPSVVPTVNRDTLSLNTGGARMSPRLMQPVGIETSSSLSISDDGLDSPERRDLASTNPMSPSLESPSSIDLVDGVGTLGSRSPNRQPTERGAPDGQERFTPPQSANLITHEGITVPQWITEPPNQSLAVRFSDDVVIRLRELIGERAEAFRSNLESLLAEDPRSQYVRSRYPDHEYNCVLEDLAISCIFDDAASVCNVVAVRSAEEMQS